MQRAVLPSLVLVFTLCSHGWSQSVYPGEDWDVATPASQQVDAAGLEKARAWLETHRSKSGLVVRHGRIIAEWSFADADRKTKLAAYSTTKSLSSVAAGLAIEEGTLKLNDAVGKYLPDVRPEGKKAITVKQLLSMTTGVHNLPDFHLRDDIFRYSMYDAAMDHEPGAKWDYNNTGLALLGPVFEKATGESLDKFFDQRVFQPIGIAASDWSWERRDGHTIPYSGCHLTARAMGRIGLLVLNEGRWRDKQVVPAKWLAESTAASQVLNPSYGYLWWNNSTNKWPGVPKDAYAAMGRWDNDILIVPSLELVVIRQSDLEPAQGHQIAEYFGLVCGAVRKTP